MLQDDAHPFARRSKGEDLQHLEALGIAKRVLDDYLPEASLGKNQSKRFCDFDKSYLIRR